MNLDEFINACESMKISDECYGKQKSGIKYMTEYFGPGNMTTDEILDAMKKMLNSPINVYLFQSSLYGIRELKWSGKQVRQFAENHYKKFDQGDYVNECDNWVYTLLNTPQDKYSWCNFAVNGMGDSLCISKDGKYVKEVIHDDESSDPIPYSKFFADLKSLSFETVKDLL